MRRLPLLIVAAVAFALLWGALPANAQDIFGLSFRPTEAAPAESERGSVDMVSGDNDAHTVSVDLTKAEASLDLADYDNAAAFIVWWVNMDGERQRLGELDDDLMLEDAETDGLIARLFLTAEADADTDEPTGERLYEVTLRNVAETGMAAAAAADDDADEDADEDADTEEEGDEATKDEDEDEDEDKDSSGSDSDEGEESNPSVLPTTGSNARDLLVLFAVATVLALFGWRVRTIRV